MSCLPSPLEGPIDALAGRRQLAAASECSKAAETRQHSGSAAGSGTGVNEMSSYSTYSAPPPVKTADWMLLVSLPEPAEVHAQNGVPRAHVEPLAANAIVSNKVPVPFAPDQSWTEEPAASVMPASSA